MKKQVNILCIDTSCDDTSVAITCGQRVLSNIVSSQDELHKKYGGVFPTVAKQAHKENINPAIKSALNRAGMNIEQIGAVAVTQGPGLAPALEVGIKKAQELAQLNQLPLIAVNHIEGHILSSLAQRKTRGLSRALNQISTPALAIVVSGGHTQFVYVEEIGKYKILGSTIDDAAGECIDKVGRMLNLGYPAGAVLEKLAKKGNRRKFKFPLPMTQSKNFDLSFSGLKTFSRNLIAKLEKEKMLNHQTICDFAASLQDAVFRHICYKLNKLLLSEFETDQNQTSTEKTQLSTKNKAIQETQKLPMPKQVWLGGGVAANTSLRKSIRHTIKPFGLSLKVPYSKKLCSDNAAMIGVAAGFKMKRNEWQIPTQKIDRKPRWEI